MTTAKARRYWIDTLRGWAEDRLSEPQFAECDAVLIELEQDAEGDTMTHTVKSLTAAIREATSLAELKKLVGPSPEEDEQARKRIAAIECMFARHGNLVRDWPDYARDKYRWLQQAQDRYESKYC